MAPGAAKVNSSIAMLPNGGFIVHGPDWIGLSPSLTSVGFNNPIAAKMGLLDARPWIILEPIDDGLNWCLHERSISLADEWAVWAHFYWY